MPFPFDVWAPILRAPFSGNVTQEIVPRVLSPDIKGSPAIETRVQAEVASFGKQLGKVLEALQRLSEATGVPLPEVERLIGEIEAVKADCRLDLREEAEAALERLRQVDDASYRQVVDASRLSAPAAKIGAGAAEPVTVR